MIAGTIYALKCTCHPDEPIKYIGKTTAGQKNRYDDHVFMAQCGSPAPVHYWMREHGTTNVESILVETITDTEPHAIDIAEGEWIRYVREAGVNLLNMVTPAYGRPNRSLPPVARTARTNALVDLL